LKNNLILILLICFASSCKSTDELKQDQYMINGERLYLQHCANCHGKNGEGLKELYPPILNADYLKNKEAVICLIKNGGKNPIVVNGKTYSQAMPKVAGLYDIDIAQISTFIFGKFEKSDSLITVENVQSINCLKE
jgi:cytochrome c551